MGSGGYCTGFQNPAGVASFWAACRRVVAAVCSWSGDPGDDSMCPGRRSGRCPVWGWGSVVGGVLDDILKLVILHASMYKDHSDMLVSYRWHFTDAVHRCGFTVTYIQLYVSVVCIWYCVLCVPAVAGG